MANKVNFLKGSIEKFNSAIEAGTIVKTNFYYIDDKDLYLGAIKLSNDEDLKNAVTSILGDYPEGATPATIKSLDTKIISLKETVDIHSALLSGLDESLPVKSLIDEVKTIGENAATAVTLLEGQVGTNTASINTINETINKINAELAIKAVWENMT